MIRSRWQSQTRAKVGGRFRSPPQRPPSDYLMFFARKKVIAAAVIILTFFLIVIGRLFYLQILRGKEYSHFSEAYTLREIPILAPRGRIFDGKGKILATTRPSFN